MTSTNTSDQVSTRASSHRVRRKPRVIEGALTPEERKRKQREFRNRYRRKELGLPPIGELGKKRKLNQRKNKARRRKLKIGPGRRRASGKELIWRGDGRTLRVKRMKEAGTWLPYEEYLKRQEEIALSRYDLLLRY